MATENHTTDTTLRALTAQARRLGFDLHRMQSIDDTPEFQLVGAVLTLEELAEVLNELDATAAGNGTRPAGSVGLRNNSVPPTWRPAPITDNDAWGWLYDVGELLAVLRRALYSEDSTIEESEAHECETLIFAARRRLVDAMGALEEWSYAQAGDKEAAA